MFIKTQFVFVALTLLATTESVVGRERWLERDNRPVWTRFARRRFGQERPAVIDELASIPGCDNGVCATLAGAAITPLLAKQPECSQQDQADAIIDAAQQFPEATKQAMIAAAIKYRQAEKNTPPDFSTNPPTNRNSVFCQKAPKNPELNGLVQAQDPANDPNLFFDPALDATVEKGSQANTEPFGGAAASPVNNGNTGNENENAGNENNNTGNGNNNAGNGNGTGADCPPNVTVTVTAGTPEPTPTAGAGNGNENNAGNNAGGNNGGGNNGNANVGDFGSCSIPEIEFGVGFDNRKESSFQPVDKASFNHGSAQNIDIITQFMCDTLTNTCGADQTAKDTCQEARAAASAATKGTGGQADAFNAVFGIVTTFNDIAAVDNQGNVVPGTGNGSNAGNGNGVNNGNNNANNGNGAQNNNGGSTGGNNGGIGDFGSCSVPEIEFGAGFDNRKETSFQPVDKASYDHGSAQNIDIITRFMCDQLTNKCKADQAAKDTCQQAAAAASAATKNTGAQADAFNAVFGITTNFNAIPAVDNQGNVVPGTGAAKRSMRRRRGIGSSL